MPAFSIDSTCCAGTRNGRAPRRNGLYGAARHRRTDIGDPLLSQKQPYRVEDFAQVAIAVATPMVLIATPSFPANTPREFVDYLKANPGKVNWASAGVNSTPHVSMAIFTAATGVNDALAQPETRRRLGDLGMDIVGGLAEDATNYVMTQAARVRGLIHDDVLTPE